MTSNADAWSEENAADNGELAIMANLAATLSHSLTVLMAKFEVLVTRLSPGAGTDTKLCIAEASLLRSVLRDLQAFATNAVFATQGTEPWVAASAPARFAQGNGTCSSVGSRLMHRQI